MINWRTLPYLSTVGNYFGVQYTRLGDDLFGMCFVWFFQIAFLAAGLYVFGSSQFAENLKGTIFAPHVILVLIVLGFCLASVMAVAIVSVALSVSDWLWRTIRWVLGQKDQVGTSAEINRFAFCAVCVVFIGGCVYWSRVSSEPECKPRSPGCVWVNTDSHVFHRRGSRWYGKTEQGKYMTFRHAKDAGNRAARTR